MRPGFRVMEMKGGSYPPMVFTYFKGTSVRKLISFDVWNTLITYNPDCAKNRNKMLSEMLNKTEDEIHIAYRNVKNIADLRAEHGHCDTEEVTYKKFLSYLGVPELQWTIVKAAVNLNFINNPPYVHPELRHMLECLHCLGYEFGTASNNNFISEHTIYTTVLQYLADFKFCVSSTNVAAAKPSPTFMKQYVSDITPYSHVTHIGDNHICDNFTDYVDRVIFVDNPAHCIHELNNILKEASNAHPVRTKNVQ